MGERTGNIGTDESTAAAIRQAIKIITGSGIARTCRWRFTEAPGGILWLPTGVPATMKYTISVCQASSRFALPRRSR